MEVSFLNKRFLWLQRLHKIFMLIFVLHTVSMKIHQKKKEKGNNLLVQAKSTIENINVDTQLLISGSDYGLNGITMAIAASAVDWGADLVVAGTSNKKGIDRFFLGSVAEELVTKVDCSIMLVRMN